MRRIVCFSGGEGSALVAIEVQRRYGSHNLVLLNHDICPRVEDQDIKRFKGEVAAFCGVPITYANMPGWDVKDQFDVVIEAGAFKVGAGTALCTNRLKTGPFMKWLEVHASDRDCVLYYGFSAKETARIQRRSSIMALAGYRTDYPLALWVRTIHATQEIGIIPPLTYSTFKHANCVGCLKAGMQHWYIVYCTRPDIWTKGLHAEEVIGYTIIKGHALDELEPKFAQMRRSGITTTEAEHSATFWARVRHVLPNVEQDGPNIPCECAA